MNEITTQKYVCGRYGFRLTLPQMGHKDDEPTWRAKVDGRELPERFATLESAMRAAIS